MKLRDIRIPAAVTILIVTSMLIPMQSYAGKINKDCTLNGKKLYGNVKVVENFPDFKIREAKNFPDLKVKKVSSFPDSCGKWTYVKNHPDFTVKFVKNFPDFEIKYVDSFPGVR